MSGSGAAAIGPDGEAAQRSSSDDSANAGSSAWKLTLPCTKSEAETVALAEIDGAALVATEEDEATGRWRLDAYFEDEPGAHTLAAVRALVEGGEDATPAPLAPADWVTLSQAGLEPVRAGRFVVHTAAHPADPPPGGRAFLIEAGQAFGTGHHETTAGCLAALDGFAAERAHFGNIVDLGSGTGLLAFAARHLWPEARVLATDIDPVAVAVLQENAAANDIPLGDGAGSVSLLVADGTHHPAIAARAPFDLVIANILAGPLIDMAAEIVAIAAPGATVLLAGLLTSQAGAVVAAYQAAGASASRSARRGDWTILELVAPASVANPLPAFGGRAGWDTDGA